MVTPSITATDDTSSDAAGCKSPLTAVRRWIVVGNDKSHTRVVLAAQRGDTTRYNAQCLHWIHVAFGSCVYCRHFTVAIISYLRKHLYHGRFFLVDFFKLGHIFLVDIFTAGIFSVAVF